MKVIVKESIESKTTIRSKMFCPKCGSHGYRIVEQLEPQVPDNWRVECEQCDMEGPESPSREIAIARWRQL